MCQLTLYLYSHNVHVSNHTGTCKFPLSWKKSWYYILEFMWGIIFFPLKQIDLHSCASIIKINFNKVWLNKTCSQNVFKLQSITSESKWHFVDPTGCMQKKKNAKKDGLVSNIMRTWNYFDVYQINSPESQWRVCCRLSNSQLICVQFP